MQAYIFANGEYCPGEDSIPITTEDLAIAADGGSRHCRSLGIRPDILIGDLDSTDPGLIREWESQGVEIIRHPPDKDQTDLELALMLAQERGASRIEVYGAVGGRLDMTLGNLTLLAHPDLLVPTTLICGSDQVHLLRPGAELELEGSPGDTVSLIPLQPGPSRVKTRGLQYPLRGENLEFGFSRGISNRITAKAAAVCLESGLLIVIHTRNQAGKED